ncbi:MAG TPA: ABC transporter permease [Thermoleophilia bacterium]|nr:ABC transporter permease [Thermoleophilia bacterium]
MTAANAPGERHGSAGRDGAGARDQAAGRDPGASRRGALDEAPGRDETPGDPRGLTGAHVAGTETGAVDPATAACKRGRAEGGARGPRGLAAAGGRFRHVWFRDAYVFVKLWKTNLFPPLIEPYLYLLALGLGVGFYVNQMDGVDYLTFVAPGIIVTTSIMQATFECTYGSYFRMAFQSTFDAIISTPVNPEEVSLGEICWGATRSVINAAALMVSLAIFGRLDLIWAPAILALQFLIGMQFGAISLLITSKVRQTEYFNFFLSGVIFPAQMLTGAFFPLSRIPEVLQPVAWAVPLTSAIDLTRGMMLDRLGMHSLLELAYVAVTTLVFVELALRSMRRRLIG